LINLTVTSENRLLIDKLSKNASNCPDIDTETILFLAEQNLRGSIPKGLNLMCESPDGQRVDSSKAKISNFHNLVIGYKNILGFEVSVNDSFGMTVINSRNELIHEKLDLLFGKGIFFGRKVFFEIVVGVFEDEIKFVLVDFVENVLEAELIWKFTE
jgi:hypothetical protein